MGYERHNNSGVILVETAILAAALFIVLFGGLEISQTLRNQESASGIARSAAIQARKRCASLSGNVRRNCLNSLITTIASVGTSRLSRVQIRLNVFQNNAVGLPTRVSRSTTHTLPAAYNITGATLVDFDDFAAYEPLIVVAECYLARTTAGWNLFGKNTYEVFIY